ncbi:maleylpyruvate isomerase [Massilia sp. PDC64]|nr:maleylacetoacetate isomerase [Massilia sp. PDC64]SDE38531.1 maleylpyruvate isomerase [Massilia sp. PDC64]
MKLYDAAISSASARVRIAFALKGLHVDRIPVGIVGEGAENRRPAYLDVNPQGLVPALLTDDGVLLTQSLAIIEYLDEIQPQAPLLPDDPATRAWVRAFVLAVLAETHALVTPRVINHLATMPGFDESTAPAWRRHWMEEGIDALEALLARRHAVTPSRFCAGDTPGLADVFLFPQALNAARAGLPLARWSHVEAVFARLADIPAFRDHAQVTAG